MTEDKLFNLLVSRTLTRETSTLTISTVTASASLILIPLFCQVDQDLSWYFGIIGIIFPIFGLLYREATYRTIQKDDYDEIKKIAKDPKLIEIIDNKNGRVKRSILFYSISSLPVVAWIIILVGLANNYGC